ncbi:MAG: ABC transporter substrate-binding protein [Ktedonobacterales bacterium]
MRAFRTVPTFPWISALLALVALLALAGCGGASSASAVAAKPALSTDALGSAITIPTHAPQRIITETPADSELVGAVGASAGVVAVDFYTDTPSDLASKPKITDGQTFNLNDEAILGYKPDLVLGYGGYFKADEQKLMTAGITVVDLPIVATVEQSLTELKLVGQLVHADAKAAQVIAALQRRIDAVRQKTANASAVSIYMDDGAVGAQYSTFGKGSYDDEVIRYAGGTNIFAGDSDLGGYPEVSAESIIKANPQVIVTVEGAQYGGDPKTIAARPGWSVIAAVQNNRVYAMDANNFSRPDAPRLVTALEDLAKALHPELFA